MADEKPNEPRKQGFIAGLGKFNYAKLNEDGTWSPVDKPPPEVSQFALFSPVTFPEFTIHTADVLDAMDVEFSAWFAANGSREQLTPKRNEAGNAVDGGE